MTAEEKTALKTDAAKTILNEINSNSLEMKETASYSKASNNMSRVEGILAEKSVKAEDMTFSKNDAHLIAYAETMDEGKANLFLQQYDGKSDVEDYKACFDLAYQYGELGFDADTVLQYKGVLTEAQVAAIYTQALKTNANRKTKRKAEIGSLVDEAYAKALTITEAGLSKNQNSALQRLIKKNDFEATYQKAVDIVRSRDKDKIEAWRDLPKDKRRHQMTTLYDTDIDAYLKEMYAKDKLPKNDALFKTIYQHMKNEVVKKLSNREEDQRKLAKQGRNDKIGLTEHKELPEERDVTAKEYDISSLLDKGGLNSYADFSKAVSDIGMRSDLTDAQKISELQKLFESSNYKADINVPSDIQYVKGFDAKGNVIYDWPPKLGFDESTIKPISRTDGLPDTWDRYGYMGGFNFADVPSTGKYSYSERAIPYIENEAAYHTGTFNNATYFDKIDAIKNGDMDTFNELLQNEGISKWDLDDFEELCDSYDSFISKANKELGDSVDVTYGIKDLAAEWGDMSGGAGQIVNPFGGDVLEKIGILKEN